MTLGIEDLEAYENHQELALFREYRDVVSIFKYVVETDRRFYLANQVDVQMHNNGGDVFFEVTLQDAWVWDIYRPSRFVNRVKVYSFKDINVENLPESEITI